MAKTESLAAQMADSHIKRAGVSKAFGGRRDLIEFYTPIAAMVETIGEQIDAMDATMEKHAARVREFAEAQGHRDIDPEIEAGLDERASEIVGRQMRAMDPARWNVALQENTGPRPMNGYGAHPRVRESNGHAPQEP